MGIYYYIILQLQLRRLKWSNKCIVQCRSKFLLFYYPNCRLEYLCNSSYCWSTSNSILKSYTSSTTIGEYKINILINDMILYVVHMLWKYQEMLQQHIIWNNFLRTMLHLVDQIATSLFKEARRISHRLIYHQHFLLVVTLKLKSLQFN